MEQDLGKSRPLERRVFREEIREQLIEDILNVREALRDLELFGFVVSSPFRGTQVRKITTEDLLEIYPIRAALEGVAARAAALRIDDATLEHLDELIRDMREAATRNDPHGHANIDGAFHHAIIKAAGNRMLEHVWQTMRLSITTCVTHAVTHRSLHELAERHVPVLDALRQHNPDLAEAELRRHIEEPGEWIRAAAASDPSRALNDEATTEAAG
jgi:DNA-binding GntR family transcriptional regulator